MAAIAATSIGSSFSTSMHAFLKLTRSKHCPSDSLLRLVLTPISQVPSLSKSHTIDPLSSVPVSRKWRRPRMSSAIAQEEAAATAPVEEEEEEEQQGTEEGGAESSVNTKLYFGNLPYSCDSAQLAAIVQQYGVPEMVEVLYDRTSGSRGFAFVTMSSAEDCDSVIQNLDGSEYMGRSLRVNFADRPKPKLPLYPEIEYKLFVGNLSWSVTSESLHQAFQEYGNVVGARVLYEGDTGRSRGYGFVCYSTKAEMETALQSLNGMELEGRAIRVSLAEGRRS